MVSYFWDRQSTYLLEVKYFWMYVNADRHDEIDRGEIVTRVAKNLKDSLVYKCRTHIL